MTQCVHTKLTEKEMSDANDGGKQHRLPQLPRSSSFMFAVLDSTSMERKIMEEEFLSRILKRG